jgi:diphosphomevalonate decarboxylase
MKARAIAHPNIALVKYWGKRSVELNLPAAGSLSLTLAGIRTETTVEFGTAESSVNLDGEILDEQGAARLLRYIDLIRSLAAEAGCELPQGGVRVESSNDFPTAAGLASSSSGFAALAAAATTALGWDISGAELSVLARRGSGSAARSIFGGFVEMRRGDLEDGSDSFAEPIEGGAQDWDLRCIIALTATGPKEISSTDAMMSTAQTSPYYQAWIDSVPGDLSDARAAILARDFDRLATVAERSCLRMHSAAIAAQPGVIFWNGLTVDVMHSVRRARSTGLPAFFTVDAGPHVKVFCRAQDGPAVETLLRDIDGVARVLVTHPGPGVLATREDRQ